MFWVILWDVFQSVFGANQEKCRLYAKFADCAPGSKVLDFGCATGITARAFEHCEYTGIDIHKDSIVRAQMKHQNEKSMHFFCGNIHNLQGRLFDHILFAGTGHHLTDDECVAILKRMKLLITCTGQIHFIDIVKTKEDLFLMKCLMAIDRGGFIRDTLSYERLFERVPELKIEIKCVENATASLAKPAFAYFRLVPQD